ncbi:hypothetical protein HK100_008181 [Physocladia obscura]|uniref:Uncharacterized protein n=1 Tax=Physocladia obscura TaxID=109957 RepID=A0AAD5T6Q7_9FUNG|nr:hypothetical protein HK100_008181 [Physocladia obscura]
MAPTLATKLVLLNPNQSSTLSTASSKLVSSAQAKPKSHSTKQQASKAGFFATQIKQAQDIKAKQEVLAAEKQAEREKMKEIAIANAAKDAVLHRSIDAKLATMFDDDDDAEQEDGGNRKKEEYFEEDDKCSEEGDRETKRLKLVLKMSEKSEAENEDKSSSLRSHSDLQGHSIDDDIDVEMNMNDPAESQQELKSHEFVGIESNTAGDRDTIEYIIRRVRRRRKITKQVKEIDGRYMSMKDVDEWESYSEEESVPIVSPVAKIPLISKNSTTENPAGSTATLQNVAQDTEMVVNKKNSPVKQAAKGKEKLIEMSEESQLEHRIAAVSLRAMDLLSRARMNADFVSMHEPKDEREQENRLISLASSLNSNSAFELNSKANHKVVWNQIIPISRSENFQHDANKSVTFNVEFQGKNKQINSEESREIDQDLASSVSFSQIRIPPTPHSHPRVNQEVPILFDEKPPILVSTISSFRNNLLRHTMLPTADTSSHDIFLSSQLKELGNEILVGKHSPTIKKDFTTDQTATSISNSESSFAVAKNNLPISEGNSNFSSKRNDKIEKSTNEEVITPLPPVNDIHDAQNKFPAANSSELPSESLEKNKTVQFIMPNVEDITHQMYSLEQVQIHMYELNKKFMEHHQTLIGQQRESVHDYVSQQMQSFQELQEQQSFWQADHLHRLRSLYSHELDQQLAIENKIQEIKTIRSSNIINEVNSEINKDDYVETSSTDLNTSSKYYNQVNLALELKEQIETLKHDLRSLAHSVSDEKSGNLIRRNTSYEMQDTKKISNSATETIKEFRGSVDSTIQQFLEIKDRILKSGISRVLSSNLTASTPQHSKKPTHFLPETLQQENDAKTENSIPREFFQPRGLKPVRKNEVVKDEQQAYVYYRSVTRTISELSQQKNAVLSSLKENPEEKRSGVISKLLDGKFYLDERNLKVLRQIDHDVSSDSVMDFMNLIDEIGNGGVSDPKSEYLTKLLSMDRIEEVVSQQIDQAILESVILTHTLILSNLKYEQKNLVPNPLKTIDKNEKTTDVKDLTEYFPVEIFKADELENITKKRNIPTPKATTVSKIPGISFTRAGLKQEPEVQRIKRAKISKTVESRRQNYMFSTAEKSIPLSSVKDRNQSPEKRGIQKQAEHAITELENNDIGESIEKYHISALSSKFLKSGKVIQSKSKPKNLQPPSSHSLPKQIDSTQRIQVENESNKPSRKAPSSISNFYNVKVANAPVFLRRSSIRPPTLQFLETNRQNSIKLFAEDARRPETPPKISRIRSSFPEKIIQSSLIIPKQDSKALLEVRNEFAQTMPLMSDLGIQVSFSLNEEKPQIPHILSEFDEVVTESLNQIPIEIPMDFGTAAALQIETKDMEIQYQSPTKDVSIQYHTPYESSAEISTVEGAEIFSGLGFSQSAPRQENSKSNFDFFNRNQKNDSIPFWNTRTEPTIPAEISEWMRAEVLSRVLKRHQEDVIPQTNPEQSPIQKVTAVVQTEPEAPNLLEKRQQLNPMPPKTKLSISRSIVRSVHAEITTEVIPETETENTREIKLESVKLQYPDVESEEASKVHTKNNTQMESQNHVSKEDERKEAESKARLEEERNHRIEMLNELRRMREAQELRAEREKVRIEKEEETRRLEDLKRNLILVKKEQELKNQKQDYENRLTEEKKDRERLLEEKQKQEQEKLQELELKKRETRIEPAIEYKNLKLRVEGEEKLKSIEQSSTGPATLGSSDFDSFGTSTLSTMISEGEVLTQFYSEGEIIRNFVERQLRSAQNQDDDVTSRDLVSGSIDLAIPFVRNKTRFTVRPKKKRVAISNSSDAAGNDGSFSGSGNFSGSGSKGSGNSSRKSLGEILSPGELSHLCANHEESAKSHSIDQAKKELDDSSLAENLSAIGSMSWAMQNANSSTANSANSGIRNADTNLKSPKLGDTIIDAVEILHSLSSIENRSFLSVSSKSQNSKTSKKPTNQDARDLLSQLSLLSQTSLRKDDSISPHTSLSSNIEPIQNSISPKIDTSNSTRTMSENSVSPKEQITLDDSKNIENLMPNIRSFSNSQMQLAELNNVSLLPLKSESKIEEFCSNLQESIAENEFSKIFSTPNLPQAETNIAKSDSNLEQLITKAASLKTSSRSNLTQAESHTAKPFWLAPQESETKIQPQSTKSKEQFEDTESKKSILLEPLQLIEKLLAGDVPLGKRNSLGSTIFTSNLQSDSPNSDSKLAISTTATKVIAPTDRIFSLSAQSINMMHPQIVPKLNSAENRVGESKQSFFSLPKTSSMLDFSAFSKTYSSNLSIRPSIALAEASTFLAAGASSNSSTGIKFGSNTGFSNVGSSRISNFSSLVRSSASRSSKESTDSFSPLNSKSESSEVFSEKISAKSNDLAEISNSKQSVSETTSSLSSRAESLFGAAFSMSHSAKSKSPDASSANPSGSLHSTSKSSTSGSSISYKSFGTGSSITDKSHMPSNGNSNESEAKELKAASESEIPPKYSSMGGSDSNSFSDNEKESGGSQSKKSVSTSQTSSRTSNSSKLGNKKSKSLTTSNESERSNYSVPSIPPSQSNTSEATDATPRQSIIRFSKSTASLTSKSSSQSLISVPRRILHELNSSSSGSGSTGPNYQSSKSQPQRTPLKGDGPTPFSDIVSPVSTVSPRAPQSSAENSTDEEMDFAASSAEIFESHDSLKSVN